MPDHPAADTAAAEPSDDEISRHMRLRTRWLTVFLTLATVMLSMIVALVAPGRLTNERFLEAVATERQTPAGDVAPGDTASFAARLAGPADKVRLAVGVEPADAPVTCEPRSVDIEVRAEGVPGGAWRRTYPGRLAPAFGAAVDVSRRARTVLVEVTPHAGARAGSCAYETSLLLVESARARDAWIAWLAGGVAAVAAIALGVLAIRKRDLFRSPPWLGPDAETQRARARERAAEQGIEDALRRGRGRPRLPESRPQDGEDTEPVHGPGGPETAAGPGRPAGPVAEPDALVLADLWTVTHARLDKYHGIAQTQARHAFRNAQVAMGIGFGMLVGFTVLALIADSTATSIVAGVLGASSAALAGFIGRTFVRSQESTVETLRAYFTQPLEFSRYLAAERLVDGADLTREQRAEILGAIAQAIVAQPGAPPQDPQQPQNPGNGR
ncbi:hypothetical protein DMB38_33215 [Streptomyces sp. WAC 06738]|uniref:TRADD-N-associated membrane domain-containing protein n=1 Tax=Streptomyces sp. WAC 06738 TaxID=2203210 RepID=UPI000F6EE386|nr:hypothetical protein [Streptomyces sp. WAC 06738]AZM50002.1 hypothetical protein DMB38_33215 [Streptomyces sp. WAC 06738]